MKNIAVDTTVSRIHRVAVASESDVADKAAENDIKEARTVRLLEEINSDEACDAVCEFFERYSIAKHKIKKSISGYFRGVCQKYWEGNRKDQKMILLKQASDCERSIERFPLGTVSSCVLTAFSLLFTPASELSPQMIDVSVEFRLSRMRPSEAIAALYEFCFAAMYRTDHIRNLNAYLMKIIKNHHHKSAGAGESNNSAASTMTAILTTAPLSSLYDGAKEMAPTQSSQYLTVPVPAAAPWVAPPIVNKLNEDVIDDGSSSSSSSDWSTTAINGSARGILKGVP